MKTSLIRIVVILLLFPAVWTGFCQSPISYLGIEQGLSNNSVRIIYQDHKGFFWFGTQDGLNRYDGYEFKVFSNNFGDSNSLVGNFVSAISEDSANNLWVGTRKGISVFNHLSGNFRTISFFSRKDGQPRVVNDIIKDIKTDGQNNILIATENSGLLFCANGSMMAKQLGIVEKSGSISYQFGVQAITIDKRGKIWAFVQGKGIGFIDSKSMVLKIVNTSIDGANSIYSDDDSLWIGSGSGLYNYQTETNSLRNVFSPGKGLRTTDPIVTVTMDREKKLWIGSNGGGISVWNTVSHKMAYLASGDGKNDLSSDVVYSIYEDQQSRKWIGTLRGGINIVDPQKERFRTVSHEPGNPQSLNSNYISAFLETSDHSLWVGTDGSGINVSRAENDSFVQYKETEGDLTSLPNDNITCMLEDIDHDIWVSTFRGGICRFNKAKGGFERFSTINSSTGMVDNVIYNLCIDRDGVLWATALRRGNIFGALYKFNRPKNRFEMFDGSLSDLFILKEDFSGQLWGGNLTQLVKIDKLNKKHVFYEIGQPVRGIQEDGQNNLWIGTDGGGLVMFDKIQGKITARYSTVQGLCSNSILSMLNDGKGSLWMGTNNGLGRFNIAKRLFQNYYLADGLQSNQFYFNSAIRLGSGAFAFGGIKGYNIFYPDKITKRASRPPLWLTSISVAGLPIESDMSLVKKISDNEIKELSVPYDKAVFMFGFTALEYSSPANISYAYYMDGWDNGWNYVKEQRTATYTHLTEGRYIFRVKSTNLEGDWNPKEIAIKVTVLPPWFRTWWACLLYGICLLLVVYLFILYKNRQERLKYEVKVAHLETEKEREQLGYQVRLAHLETEKEREVNEKRLSFFTNISHEFRAPLTLIINPIKEIFQSQQVQKPAAEQELGTVYRNARRLLSLVDQLLLFSKSESGIDKMRVSKVNFYTLCQEVFLCFVQQAKAKEIVYIFSCDNQGLELYVDHEKMEIILYNLVSNALKYTPNNGKIEMQITETDNLVNVAVIDTGAGISPDIGSRLFSKFYRAETKTNRKQTGFGIGLYLAKHFAEEHQGEISYQSEVGKGTTFLLNLQKGKCQFDPSVIVEESSDTTAYLREVALEEAVESSIEKPVVEFKQLTNVITERRTILLVDDDQEIRMYIAQIFKNEYVTYEAVSGEDGLKMAKEYQPDIIISDIKMQDFSGIDLCKTIKQDPSLNHIPVILLTGTSSEELKLEGITGGADDYITKPFNKDLLVARVTNLLKNRNNLQQYFYNKITLNKQNLKISSEYKEFLERCIEIVEKHLDDDQFNIKALSSEIGMSHSVVYKKIKAISGQSLNGFIRFIRLRKAARLFIDTNGTVIEVAEQVGMYDQRYFRENFNKVFGMNPSEYIKKFRKPFAGKFNVNKSAIEDKGSVSNDY